MTCSGCLRALQGASTRCAVHVHVHVHVWIRVFVIIIILFILLLLFLFTCAFLPSPSLPLPLHYFLLHFASNNTTGRSEAFPKRLLGLRWSGQEQPWNAAHTGFPGQRVPRRRIALGGAMGALTGQRELCDVGKRFVILLWWGTVG